ncbi:MAG TPA: hypothetical protein VF242_06310 [Nitrososphaeraceae archaeon]
MQHQLDKQKKFIICKNCSYRFDPSKEGNARKRKCGMCCFGDSYTIRSKKEYERNLLMAMIESQQQ